MRLFQRFTSAIGWGLAAVVGTLVTLEATGVVGGGWRAPIESVLSSLAEPSSPRWLLTLGGLALGAIAIIVLIAQIVPTRRAVPALEIDNQSNGSTILRAPVIYRRVGHALAQVDGVHTVTPRPHHKRLAFSVELIDSASIATVAASARRAITPEVWASLGIPDRPVDLVLTYRRNATPVSRKEQLV